MLQIMDKKIFDKNKRMDKILDECVTSFINFW